MNPSSKPFDPARAALLFLPWGLSSLLASSPISSWWVAWLGSIAIFLYTWSGNAGGFENLGSKRIRVLHPLFLMQGIFAGYGFLTAIFYWFDINGFSPTGAPVSIFLLSLETCAEAQRLYVLAHASLALGLLLAIKPARRHPSKIQWSGSAATLLLVMSGVAAVAGILLSFIPGLTQFVQMFSRLSVVAGAASLGPSLKLSNRHWLPLSAGVNAFLLLAALASGWKEEVLVLVILQILFSFPYYPKIAVSGGLTVFVGFLFVLPLMVGSIRSKRWDEKKSKWETLSIGIETLMDSSPDQMIESNWQFLTGRLSEVSMFGKFIESVNGGSRPEGLAILGQALISPVPRILWTGKPDLERLVMRRAYNHGVISEMSNVSAKPHPSVDAYLMGGRIGTFLSFVFIGWVGSTAFAFCRDHFGGVLLGGLFFNGLFSILWRGNAFEFMMATLVSAVLMALALSQLFKVLGWTLRLPSRNGSGSKTNKSLRRRDRLDPAGHPDFAGLHRVSPAEKS